jgi:hypothetical protein
MNLPSVPTAEDLCRGPMSTSTITATIAPVLRKDRGTQANSVMGIQANSDSVHQVKFDALNLICSAALTCALWSLISGIFNVGVVVMATSPIN